MNTNNNSFLKVVNVAEEINKFKNEIAFYMMPEVTNQLKALSQKHYLFTIQDDYEKYFQAVNSFLNIDNCVCNHAGGAFTETGVVDGEMITGGPEDMALGQKEFSTWPESKQKSVNQANIFFKNEFLELVWLTYAETMRIDDDSQVTRMSFAFNGDKGQMEYNAQEIAKRFIELAPVSIG